MKNKLAKGALVLGMTAMSVGAMADEAMGTEDNQNPQSVQMVTNTNVRKIVGNYIAQRETGLYVDRKTGTKYFGEQQDIHDEQYVTFLLDRDNDGIEDYICLRKSMFMIEYAPGTRVEVTEKLEAGQWIMQDIRTLARWTSRPVVYEPDHER